MDMRTGIFGEIKSSRSECSGVVGFLVAKDSYYFVWPAKVIQNKGEYNSSVTNYTKKRPTYLAPQYNYIIPPNDVFDGDTTFELGPIYFQSSLSRIAKR